LAAKQADFAEIPAIIHPISEAQKAKIQLVENTMRNDLLVIEFAEAANTLKEKHGIKFHETAKLSGLSPSSLPEYLNK
jgi:ParB/RepB/Spo0J family partition protein